MLIGGLVLGMVGVPTGWMGWRIAGRVLAERDEGIATLPPWSAPVAAVAGGALFAAAVAVIGWEAVLVGYLWFGAVTLTLLLTDLRAQLIPDRINFPATGVAAALLVVGAVVDGDTAALPRAALGAAIYFALLMVLFLVGGGGSFGGGDVKLAPLLGLYTAYLGWGSLAAAVVLGFLLGGVVAIGLIVLRLRALRDHFAFGPVLIIGAYVAIPWGESLVDWYLG